jgi:hypothetical protein
MGALPSGLASQLADNLGSELNPLAANHTADLPDTIVMRSFLLRRLLLTVLFPGVVTLVFSFIHLAGYPYRSCGVKELKPPMLSNFGAN